MSGTVSGLDISSLAPATQANATDIIPATQGSIGPMTGTTRGVTQAQIIAAGGTVVKQLALVANQSVFGANLLSSQATIDQALAVGTINPTFNKTTITASMNGHELWCNFDNVIHNVSGGDSSPSGNLVGRYIGVQRNTNALGTPLLGSVIAVTDNTGNASGTSGGLYALELDIQANGADNGGVSVFRRGLFVSLRRPAGVGALPSAQVGISIEASSGDALGYFQGIEISAPIRDAAIDLRSVTTMAGGSGVSLWLAQGQKIALDTAGAAGVAKVTLSSDGTSLIAPESIKLGATGAVLLADDAAHSILASSVPFRVPGYTVATLPAVTGANLGSLAWASDARQSGQGAGLGTGCLVAMDGGGTWRAVWSGLAPTT